ncbi:MAG: EcsC family protein [Solirubrobacteraceae bacterium MAG38_C4-C5]|nr:EcsC family protein [Candidatus Siliceabacter maunaloa]
MREPVSRGGRKVAERAKDVPGAEALEAALGEALDTATGALAVVAGSTLPTRRILGAYGDAGHDVGSIDEIRRLALQRIDEVRPTANSRYLRYVGSGVTSGVAAGVAITGGEVVAASGVGAAPGAGAVLTAMAADAAFTTLAASRAIFESALYHGFDISRPKERIRAMSVLNRDHRHGRRRETSRVQAT